MLSKAQWGTVGLSVMLGLAIGCDGNELVMDAGRDPDVCAAAADGTECGSGMHCVGEACVDATCGDGFIDSDAGEQCEDGNTVAFDGCEPTTCMYTCSSDAGCDDGLVCNGVETCDTTAHTCSAGAAPGDGTDCAQAGGEAGTCRGIECVPLGCGNGVTDMGEDCDDGNTDPDDGCENDCTFSCVVDEDCTDGDVCTGMESCDTTTHVCQPGTALVCDDGDDCTANNCDAAEGCQHPLIDADGDGHAPDTFTCGDDCDDTNPIVFTGAEELCDGVDNNCNTDIDEVAPTWYVDCDMDGYAATGASSRVGCTEPAGSATGCMGRWTTLAPAGSNIDCHDSRADVHPGQTSWFGFPYTVVGGGSTSYDYDCNGTETTRYRCQSVTDRSDCCVASTSRCASSGWHHTGNASGCTSIWSPVPPACGQSAGYLECTTNGSASCGGAGCVTNDIPSRRQECH